MQKIFFPILILFFLIIGTGAFAQEINLPAVSGAELPAVSKIELSNSGLAPDSPFYFLDTLAEKISLFFTFDIVKKAEKAFQYAGEKLAEVKAMAEAHKIEALKKSGQKYQEYLASFFKKGGEAYETGKDVKELEETSKRRSLDYLRVLADTREEAPEEAKVEIEKIIKVSREVFGEHIWGLHEKEAEWVEPEQVIDETADWKIYRNEKYGFEMRYPPQYSLKEIEEKSVISFWPTIKSPYLVIWVLNNPRNYTLEKFYNFYNLPENKKLQKEEVGKIVYPYYESPDSIESMEIGGISAVKFVVGGYWRLTISIPYKDKIFEIQAQPSAAEEKIFNQILSTFKFIK